jgi:hypothetical protein
MIAKVCAIVNWTVEEHPVDGKKFHKIAQEVT